MARGSKRENPFQPGAGARPPVLAGRENELALAEELLDSLEVGRRPSRGLLFFGPRGNGKTVLLARIAEEARRRGLRAESLPASAFRDPEALRHELQENAGLTGTRLRSAQAAGFGVSADPGPPTRNAARLLAGWIGAAPAPLVILLDEAHTIEPDAGRLFFEAVQEATVESRLFVLFVAGTPDTPRQLRHAGTFTERALARTPVGRLVREATLRAFTEPARGAGLPCQPEAATSLAEESQDYPYFIQLLGSAAWQAASDAGGAEIGIESARAGIASARLQIQRFYAERLDEAVGRKVEGVLVPLAALMRDQGGRVGVLEFRRLLAGIAAGQPLPGDEGWLLETLSDLGVVWRTAAGWEMGIPSFGDYLLALAGPGIEAALRLRRRDGEEPPAPDEGIW